MPLRLHLEPVQIGTGPRPWSAWDEQAGPEVVATEAPIVQLLCAVMLRRLLIANASASDGWTDFAKVTAWPSDIAAFIEGSIDDEKFRELLWATSLIDFSKEVTKETLPKPPREGLNGDEPPGLYAQLKLCFTSNLPEDKKVPVEPVIFNLAASGDGTRASKQALRRLHASSIPVRHLTIPLNGRAASRSAAALAFPLWKPQLNAIGRIVGDAEFFHNYDNTN